MTSHVGGWYHTAILEVVGDVQQAADEYPVAGNGLVLDIVTGAAQWQATGQETALGTHRHDHRVFHVLGLDQAEHLGAEVFFAVRPAQTATGHVAKAQMHPFDPRRINEYLELGHRLGQVGNQLGVELEAEIRFGLAIGIRLIEVGTQGCLDEVQITTQDAVFVEYLHIVQGAQNRLFEALLLVIQIIAAQLARQVETGLEQARQFAGDIGVVVQGAGDIAQIETKTNLLEVARIGT